MMISILCPVYNEEKYIEQCVTSVLSFKYPQDEMEVFFIDGQSTDKTRSIILQFKEQYPFIQLIDNPHKIVPCAMNIGIKKATGEIIIRLDAHTSYPSNYPNVLVEQLKLLGADNVGAVCKTDVKNKTKTSLAIREVLSHRFGVGNSFFRTGVDKTMEVDTVPFGCFRRDVFDRFGWYNIHLVRNQDIELNKRIKRGGGKIYLIPGIYCTYFARENYNDFIKSNYGNGLWNLMTLFYTKTTDSLSLRHFIPLFFVLSLILPLLGMIIWMPLGYLCLFSCLFYLFLITIISIQVVHKKKISLLHLIWAFLTLHIPYGWGSLTGSLRILRLCLFYKR